MQQKLQKYFGDTIHKTEINGKPNVVTFRKKAKALLHDFYSQQKADLDTEKMKIVETAAKLIGNDIKAMEKSHNVYHQWKHQTAHFDILWKTSVMTGSPKPMWSGMMQLVH